MNEEIDMSNEREQSTDFESMECGHSGRYRYNKGYDPDNPCEDQSDQTEDWSCSLCDLRECRRNTLESALSARITT